MIKKELLSPAGNWDCLVSAVHNGCDAVYVGGKKFGARAFANNFTEEEMIKSIKYCHLYGVKIYVTVNTMIYEKEMKECLEYIRFLHKNNVDAVIMQDLGLITKVKESFPNLEIHASTQMHTHNKEQIKLLEELGIKRVVLARELSLEEINKIQTTMEIEAFIHGALCISYSGQCLFSSLLLNRSGNRGSCAGICRLPFKLMEENQEIKTEGEYLLSPREFSTLDHFKAIKNSKIYSLKIEGRMKSPAYVGFITRLYRSLLDDEKEITKEEQKKLATIFNRGFTSGHMFQSKNKELMNIKTSNHQGIEIGEVVECTKEKIKIFLKEDLNQEDGIRFSEEDKGFIVNFLYNEKGLLTNKAFKNTICYVDNKIGLKGKGKVIKTIDALLNKEMEQIKEKKIPITCFIEAKINTPLKIIFSDGERKVESFGKIITKALNNATQKSVFEEKISSLGNTPFVLKEIEIEKDENIFIPLSELKRMRRELADKLIEERKNNQPHLFIEKKEKENKEYKKEHRNKINISVLVRTEEQLKTCLQEQVHTLYVTDEKLYQKYKENKNIFLRLSRVMNHFPNLENESLLVGETGSLHKYGQKNKVVTDYYMNVANSRAISYLISKGAEKVTLSIENTLEDVKEMMRFVEEKEKIEVFIYGRPEVMVMKYCPLEMLLPKEKKCSICLNGKKYYLKDRKGKMYPIQTEPKENHLTHVFYYKNREEIENIKTYQSFGIQNFRVELLDETETEIKSILCKIRKCQI